MSFKEDCGTKCPKSLYGNNLQADMNHMNKYLALFIAAWHSCWSNSFFKSL